MPVHTKVATKAAVRNVGKTPYMRRANNAQKYKKQGAAVGALLKQVSESKVVPMEPVDESPGYACTTGSFEYHWLGCTGPKPSYWTGTWNDIGGFTIPAGDGFNQRNGKEVFLRQTNMKMSIDRNSVSHDIANNAPIKFRVIVFKERREGSRTTGADPGHALLLNTDGTWVGSKDVSGLVPSSITGNDLMMLSPNRKKFMIFMDKKFVLGSPGHLLDAGTISDSRYPSTKDLQQMLWHKIKAEFGGDNYPDNYNSIYGIAIFASPVGKDNYATNWEVNLRGATSYYDN